MLGAIPTQKREWVGKVCVYTHYKSKGLHSYPDNQTLFVPSCCVYILRHIHLQHIGSPNSKHQTPKLPLSDEKRADTPEGEKPLKSLLCRINFR